jgi:hypothetical protein
MTDTMTSQNIDLSSHNRAGGKDNTGRRSQTTKMALPQKPFGIGHIFIYYIYPNIVLSSRDTLYIYRRSQEECARLREGVPYVKVYRYNPKQICGMLNSYGDNGQRKVWSSLGFHALYLSAESLINFLLCVLCHITTQN